MRAASPAIFARMLAALIATAAALCCVQAALADAVAPGAGAVQQIPGPAGTVNSTPPTPSPSPSPAPSVAGPASPTPIAGASAAAPVPAAATPVANPSPAVADLNQTEIRRGPAALPTANPAAPAAQAPSSTMELGRVVGALAAVVGLILVLRWGSRKILAIPGAGASSHIMRVVARTPLAPKQSVLLLRVGQRLMVVGDSGGQLSSLGQITDADEVAALLGQAKSTVSTAPTNFGGVLRKLSKRFRPGVDLTDGEEEASETDADTRRERGLLLAGSSAADISDADSQVGLDDEAARQAVEAARRDVASLREKLREVSQKIVGNGGSAAAPDGAGPAAGAA